jgi:biopolymer transport protein ExbD
VAFGGFRQASDGGQPMAEINMIPLIDVMLVLLVIFIVTAPLLTHAVKVDLPRAASSPNLTQPDNIQLALRESGEILWNGEPQPREEIARRFGLAAQQTPQPELHIRADRRTPYERMAEVMSDAARAGLTRIGFVTDPTGAAMP